MGGMNYLIQSYLYVYICVVVVYTAPYLHLNFPLLARDNLLWKPYNLRLLYTRFRMDIRVPHTAQLRFAFLWGELLSRPVRLQHVGEHDVQRGGSADLGFDATSSRGSTRGASSVDIFVDSPIIRGGSDRELNARSVLHDFGCYIFNGVRCREHNARSGHLLHYFGDRERRPRSASLRQWRLSQHRQRLARPSPLSQLLFTGQVHVA